jgi:hypothetical protein
MLLKNFNDHQKVLYEVPLKSYKKIIKLNFKF